MKPATFVALIGVLIFAGAYSGRAEVDEDPVVTIAPKRVVLLPVHKADTYEDMQMLDFTIANRAARPWRVCRFYECWSPILLSESDGFIKPTWGGRDATMAAKLSDFPVLQPRQFVARKISCRAVASNETQGFEISDGIGGITGFPAKPGKYKLCIRYQVPSESHGPLDYWFKEFRLKPSDFWPDWTVSNWIDIVIRNPK